MQKCDRAKIKPEIIPLQDGDSAISVISERLSNRHIPALDVLKNHLILHAQKKMHHRTNKN